MVMHISLMGVAEKTESTSETMPALHSHTGPATQAKAMGCFSKSTQMGGSVHTGELKDKYCLLNMTKFSA